MASVYPNRKDGKVVSYKIKAYLGRDETGKQVFRCKTWIPEKPMAEARAQQMAEKEAVLWEQQMCEQFRQEQRNSQQIALAKFVYQEWFPKQMSEQDHRMSTIAFHTYMLSTILSKLGEYNLSELTPKTLESFFDYLRNTHQTKKGAPLSQKTLRHHYVTLNLVLEYAVKRDYIGVNPLHKVEKPKVSKHKVDALSKGEVLTFIKEIEKLPLKQRLIYLLLLTTGMRRGECFGLRWADVDIVNAVVSVRRNVTYTAQGGVRVGLPKTEMGVRTIPLTAGVIHLLEQYREEEEANSKRLGDMFLFHTAESPGEPQDPSYITKHMRQFMKRIGLPNMSPHDLRHTCASMLLQSGADIKSVQDILGHADASTTLNFYARSNIETMRASTQKAFDL